MPVRRKKIAIRKRGGFLPLAALIPLLSAAVPGVLGTIGASMGIAKAARDLQGKGLAIMTRKRLGGKLKRKPHKSYKKGRGIFSDLLSKIGLGMRSHGVRLTVGERAKLRKMLTGRGLAPMYPTKLAHLVGRGMLYPPGGHRSIRYGGLLSPAGGAVVRKGHYRYTPSGKRVHVKAVYGGAIKVKSHMRKMGRGRYMKVKAHRRGGYMPYTFHSRNNAMNC